MADTETGSAAAGAVPIAAANGESEATAAPAFKKGRGSNNRRKAHSNSAQQTDLVDADVEKEFLTLMAKMRKTQIGQHLVYQINNYVEGIECTFRIGREQAETPFTRDFTAVGHKERQQQQPKERRELTPEERARLEAKREKRRISRKKNLEKKLAAQAAEKAEEAAEGPAAAAGDAKEP